MENLNKHCSCGNTLLVVVNEFESDTGFKQKSPWFGNICPVCGHYHEFNPETKTWTEFAWDGAQRKWVSFRH